MLILKNGKVIENKHFLTQRFSNKNIQQNI